MNISNQAEIKDSQIKSEAVDIEDRAKLIGVQIAAKKITIKSNAILTNCKLFSDGEISRNWQEMGTVPHEISNTTSI